MSDLFNDNISQPAFFYVLPNTRFKSFNACLTETDKKNMSSEKVGLCKNIDRREVYARQD